MKTALYARVSTDSQTADNQLPELRELADRYELSVVKEYVDVASGVRRRPELEQLVRDARGHRFKVLVVWALDRLGRSMLEVLNRLEELRQLRVRVISVKEPWLDAGPASDLIVAVMAWAAQFERARLVERTKAGLERARAQGKQLGRPPKDLDPQRLRYLVQHNGKRATAKMLGISRNTLARALARHPGPENQSAGGRGGPNGSLGL